MSKYIDLHRTKVKYPYLPGGIVMWRAITDGKIILNDICRLNTWISGLNHKGFRSESDTLVVHGNLKYNFDKRVSEEERRKIKALNQGVFVKASFFSKNPKENNSLKIEIQIYKDIINYLVESNVTPHLITYYLSKECSVKKMHPLVTKLIERLEKNELSSEYQLDKIHILATEKSNGIILADFLESKPSVENIKIVLIQCLYTIECFNRIGLRHNDLHLGNVLVETLPKPQKLAYVLDDGVVLVMETRIMVKFIDFDTSSLINKKGNLRNTKLESYNFCRKYGICNEINAKFDVFLLLSAAQDIGGKYKGMLFLKKFVRSHISEDLLKIFVQDNKSWFNYRLCKLDFTHPNKCKGNYVPTDEEMHSVLEMLHDFPDFTIPLDQLDFEEYNVYWMCGLE